MKYFVSYSATVGTLKNRYVKNISYVALQILQITLLMADYMNMIGKTAPGTLSTSATPVATPKNHHRIKPEAVGGSRGGGFESRGCTSRSSSRARGQLLTAPNTPRPDHKELTPRLSGVISSTGHKS